MAEKKAFEIKRPVLSLTTLRDPPSPSIICARMCTSDPRTHTHPPAQPSATSLESLVKPVVPFVVDTAEGEHRTCSQALLFNEFYCCFQPARNWLTGSDDKYRTLAGTRVLSKWCIEHCLVASTWHRGFAL